jgi:hypothetical protein
MTARSKGITEFEMWWLKSPMSTMRVRDAAERAYLAGQRSGFSLGTEAAAKAVLDFDDGGCSDPDCCSPPSAGSYADAIRALKTDPAEGGR